MRKLIFLLTMLLTVSASLGASNGLSREHRAIWLSPMQGEWPGKITTEYESNLAKSRLRANLKNYADWGINVIYYHARAMCDATYRSSLEPWGQYLTGTRGQEPFFDPMQYVIETAHSFGIEVYAWVNPYRYSANGSGYGSHPLNYEVSHPDWVLKYDKILFLNPALPEVQQRLADVVTEIVTNYDVDGLVFDDYFYANGSGNDMTLDAEQYAAYKAAKGELSQADWRRQNVNLMIKKIGETVKSVKPWAVFGISPPGVASPTNVVTDVYGLPPAPGTDWQYNGQFSDPLNWIKNGYIDYISPQIYWPTSQNFNELVDWWAMAARKFNRHFYASTTLSNSSTYGSKEYIAQIEHIRQASPADETGIAFFTYSTFNDHRERVDGVLTPLGQILGDNVFTTRALRPIVPWATRREPQMEADVVRSGSTLTWKAAPAGRYTVYAVPVDLAEGQFNQQRDYLAAVVTGESYAIPDSYSSGYRFAVAVYDRYGNEYGALAEGASPATVERPVLQYPDDNSTPVDLFDFEWTGNAPKYCLEVATDREMTKLVISIETAATRLTSADLANLVDGQTYYWRVSSMKTGCDEAASPIRSFVCSRIKIENPGDGVALTPEIKWSNAAEGTEYNLEISTSADFKGVVHSVTTTTTSHIVPELKLWAYTPYYARVTGRRGDSESVSEPVSFTTLEMKFDSAPEIVSPSADGVTLHSNSTVVLSRVPGLKQHTIEIAASSSFPSRSKYTVNAIETPELSTFKIAGKQFEAGKTYYVRSIGSYDNATGKGKKTPYSAVRTFVYSDQAGVDEIVGDGGFYIDGDKTLHVDRPSTVSVYSPSGVMTDRFEVVATRSLLDLPAGIHIISANGKSIKFVR